MQLGAAASKQKNAPISVITKILPLCFGHIFHKHGCKEENFLLRNLTKVDIVPKCSLPRLSLFPNMTRVNAKRIVMCVCPEFKSGVFFFFFNVAP